MRNIFCYFNENQFIYFNNKNLLFLNKILKIFIFYILLSFNHYNYFNNKIIIEIDNNIKNYNNNILFENDLDFSNYTTKIKAIAIFYPEYLYFNNNYFNKKKINKSNNFNNSNQKFNGYKNIYYEYINNKNYSIIEFIKLQVKLAKHHGIYGFAINYYWFSGKILYDEPINLLLNNKEINFPFFIIWKNDKYKSNYYYNNTNILIKSNFTIYDINNFIKDIKKYIISENYIKIKKIPILGIYEPLMIPNFTFFIYHLRKHAKKYDISKIYILGGMNKNQYLKYKNLIDSFFEFPPKNINFNKLFKNKYYYYYEGLIYRGNFQKEKFFKEIFLEYDNSFETVKNPIIFKEYSPEKLYLLIQRIIISSKIYEKNNNYFLFINGWNNWKEGSYLEPDYILGYASINALSKALFNISYRKENYNLEALKINCKIAIQAHIFYEDLIEDIIKKINNIPVKFDLFISTTSLRIMNILKDYIIKNSKANRYEIIIVNNKGRDVLPFLIQLKNKVKSYKYLCHIHSKKSKTSPEIGISWRNYLYSNLLGNERIISEILTDFENNDKLGFIFPETFYEIIEQKLILTEKTIKYIKYLIKKLFPKYKIGAQLDFPAGNMFWAKTKAIFQIFDIDLTHKFDKEKDQTNDTIMHGIERIWLYLVKINGYYYKTIFYYF